MLKLDGQVCVVAGASSGIGREIAIQIAKCGVVVICTARRKEKLDETVRCIEQNDGVAEALKCDFKCHYEVEQLAEYVFKKYKKIDIWINGIGVNDAMGVMWETDYLKWISDLEGNLKTCYIGTRSAINIMRKQGFGRIINMSGGGVEKPEIYNSAYSCAKTALVRFTECISLELKMEKVPIKVFSFDPGLVRTERTLSLAHLESTKKFMPGIIDKILNNDATPILKPVQFIIFIASGMVDKLDGCLLNSFMDKEELTNNENIILKEGLYKLYLKK